MMSKVITFSRVFPSYHPRKGEPTYFQEKVLLSLSGSGETSIDDGTEFNEIKLNPKHHTIRAGHRWNVGDKFSPRVWSGKPYASKQITFAPDIEIKKVYDFEIKEASKELPLDYDTDIIINHRFYQPIDEVMKTLAKNDGLMLPELLQWFKYPKPFTGQIICWNENINY